MKKKPFVMIVLASALSLWPLEILAQSDTLRVCNGEGHPGTTGNIVTAELVNVEPIAGVQMTLLFDATAIRPLAVSRTARTNQVSLFNWNVPHPGQLILLISDFGNNVISPGHGPIAQIDFKVYASASPGSYPLDVTTAKLSDRNAQSVQVVAVDDTFRVLASTPVELVSFSATVIDQAVHMHWKTASETNNYGFEIQRGQTEDNFRKFGFVSGNGTTIQSRSYTFIDPAPAPGSAYYRLKQIDSNGSFTFSGTVEVSISIPGAYALEQNFPNPFNAETMVTYQIPNSSRVNIQVFNLLGQEVKTLVNELKPAGTFRVRWDGSDSRGKPLPSGIYLCHFAAGDFAKIIRMVLMR